MRNTADKEIRVGIISDTHGLLRPEAIDALRGSDHIIHAGDIGYQLILDQLKEIAPVTAVRGNVDRGTWAKGIPVTNVFEAGGVSFYVLHILDQLDLKPETAAFKAVIYGHSHAPKKEIKNGVLYFNPGSAGPRRFNLPATVGKILIRENQLTSEIIDLQIQKED